eukprot:gnl/MRDRNA2_/MRDRNA2_98698_c0_seq1.p1 gnl/MRDRNA2_/MRDRNA2_98698_c0~~gnl/MRDRNA2_/MRDRNA2_98698_c0_seq1.p1  ORF type:complete len:305 (-),score=85.19 gnl/MRDRNA2_/MRDRNA2_98698_c0_seq1:142-1056(-)
MVASGFTAILVLCAVQTASTSRSLRWASTDVSKSELSDQQFWDDDQKYWAEQFGQLQKDVFQLQKSIGKDVTIDLQVSAQNVSNSTSVAAQVKLHNSTVAVKTDKIANATDAFANAATGLAGLPSMQEMQSKATLIPMLAMLKGMYDDQKHRIAELNKHEEESKKRFAKQKVEYEERIAHIKNQTLLSDGTRKNATEQATKFFKYWERARERSHRQFHNALKITHSSMQKEKEMISAYEKAISGVAPTAKDKSQMKQLKQSLPEQAPEVVLAQQRKIVAAFCQDTLKEINVELHEQKKMDPDLK